MANITKADLLDAVAGSAGVSKVQAEAVLGSFFGFVTTSAKAGDKVAWPGFGSFSLKENAARTGRNPQTGAPVKIKASKGMRFAPSSTLKTALNTKGKAPAKKAAPAAKKAAPATKKAAPAKKAAAPAKKVAKKR